MARKNRIWLQVQSGLCNRLPTLFTVAGVCDNCDKELMVIWPMGKQRIGPTWHADLEDLFVSGPWKHVTKCEAKEATKQQLVVNVPDIFENSASTYNDGDISFALENMKLQPGIITVAKQTVAKLGPGKKIGFHVRVTGAHPKTKKAATADWFLQRIDELRNEHPTAGMFLSTDCPATRDTILKRFPGIAESMPVPEYNSKEGVVKGMVDLCVLGQMDYIVGSYWSSFTGMAGGFQTGNLHRWYGETLGGTVWNTFKPETVDTGFVLK